MIVLQSAKMSVEVQNKLLKILEELPQLTVFILLTDAPERLLLDDRQSRAAHRLPLLPRAPLARIFSARNHIDPTAARDIAHISNGSYVQALLTSWMKRAKCCSKKFQNSNATLLYAQGKRFARLSTSQPVGGASARSAFSICARLVVGPFIISAKLRSITRPPQKPNSPSTLPALSTNVTSVICWRFHRSSQI